MNNITIGNRTLPCRITMGAMVRFKRLTGKDVREMDQNDVESMLQFVWCCVKSACVADKVEFEDSFDEFADKLDPNDFTSFFGEMADASQKKTNEATK